jgi:hypothetical protein
MQMNKKCRWKRFQKVREGQPRGARKIDYMNSKHIGKIGHRQTIYDMPAYTFMTLGQNFFTQLRTLFTSAHCTKGFGRE